MGKIGAIIPIRLASERLPNKAINVICGKPIVCHLLDRVFASKHVKKKDVVVCTTKEESDDQLVRIVESYGASVFRGSTNDIIRRFHDCIESFKFDAVIQVDGDDILCDPGYMDMTITKLLSDTKLDIVTCDGLPLGIASKSFTRNAMQKVYQHYCSENNDTGFIYFFTKTGLCNMAVVKPLSEDHVLDDARLTLDYKEDLELFTIIFEALYKEGEVFTLEEIISFLKKRPALLKHNTDINDEYWRRTKEKARLDYKDDEGLIKSVVL